jgi:hypothetical protein
LEVREDLEGEGVEVALAGEEVVDVEEEEEVEVVEEEEDERADWFEEEEEEEGRGWLLHEDIG